MAKSFKDYSRTNWAPEGDDGTYPGHERIQIGCLQRIADAAEIMAKDRQELINKCEWLKDTRNHYRNMYEAELRKNAALKGVITKLKKRLNKTS